MTAVGQYDGDLQQFVESPRKAKVGRLLFERWLVDNDPQRREHEAFSAPAGDFAIALVVLQQDRETV